MTSQALLTYRQRLALLRERKLQQTREKFAKWGYWNNDDHGVVLPPEDFHWEPTPTRPDGSWHGAKGRGANFRSLMEVHPTYVDPLDALAGRWMVYFPGVPWPQEFDYPHLKPEQEKYDIYPGIGGTQHFGPDYRIGLKLGWGGLLKKVRHFRSLHAPEKAEFFQAEEHAILGVQNWISRTLLAIDQAQQAESRPELKENLRQIAEVNRWILENPPRTLREACQWIAWFNMASRCHNGDGAGGQLDELLRPYYERDLAAGVTDDETAIFYIACLLLNDPHYYQLSGPDEQGRDLTSHVSYLILEAAHRLSIPCNLTIRVHDGMDEQFFLKSVQYLFEDRQGWPRFLGDKAIVEGFSRNGYPPALGRRRIAVGCQWVVIPAIEYTLNDIVKINVAKVFEVALWEMLNDNAAAPNVASLWTRFKRHLRKAVLCTARGFDVHLAHMKDVNPELLINLLCEGPIEKGLDASAGGVELFNMGVDGVGLATIADSFAALEQRIEKEGVLTWEEIAHHLRNDYAGTTGERVRLMMRTSQRYGQGNSLGDSWALRVSQLFTRLVKEKPTPEGRNMIPGWFSWALTIQFGKKVGATPNGRRAADPISHGANPDPGFRKDAAPTAMAKAVAAIQPGYGNTTPIQLELDPGISKLDGGVEKIASLIKTHFDLGGTLFNINIIDKEKLLEAHRDPSKYPDLVVRVTGFTAFFASLSPEFRQLVIDRIIAK